MIGRVIDFLDRLILLKRDRVQPIYLSAISRAFAPHCDQRILHAPGECVYCDHYPDWQEMRDRQHINFTGHSDPLLGPDPAGQFRSPESLAYWPGNRPA